MSLRAMAPQTATSDEGYLAIKTAIVGSIRETSRFVAGTAGVMIDRQLLEREAPQMIRLIATVAERLGITVTQKELGILVPVAGAVLNGSINLAFQQVSHQTAKDYFRRLLLEDRYGDELDCRRDLERDCGIAHEEQAPTRLTIGRVSATFNCR